MRFNMSVPTNEKLSACAEPIEDRKLSACAEPIEDRKLSVCAEPIEDRKLSACAEPIEDRKLSACAEPIEDRKLSSRTDMTETVEDSKLSPCTETILEESGPDASSLHPVNRSNGMDVKARARQLAIQSAHQMWIKANPAIHRALSWCQHCLYKGLEQTRDVLFPGHRYLLELQSARSRLRDLEKEIEDLKTEKSQLDASCLSTVHGQQSLNILSLDTSYLCTHCHSLMNNNTTSTPMCRLTTPGLSATMPEALTCTLEHAYVTLPESHAGPQVAPLLPPPPPPPLPPPPLMRQTSLIDLRRKLKAKRRSNEKMELQATIEEGKLMVTADDLKNVKLRKTSEMTNSQKKGFGMDIRLEDLKRVNLRKWKSEASMGIDKENYTPQEDFDMTHLYDEKHVVEYIDLSREIWPCRGEDGLAQAAVSFRRHLKRTKINRSPGGTPIFGENKRRRDSGQGLTPLMTRALRKKFSMVTSPLSASSSEEHSPGGDDWNDKSPTAM